MKTKIILRPNGLLSAMLLCWVLLVNAGNGLPTSIAPVVAAPDVALRVNQVGYLPSEEKKALALSGPNQRGKTFSVVRQGDGVVVFTGRVGADRGRYGSYNHLYELDFSAVTTPGKYRLALGGAASPTFTIGEQVYVGVVSATLRFFRVQRCGANEPFEHGVCHLRDGAGIAKGGPLNGKSVNAAGGWHDAGDYLKFFATASATTDLMLVAYSRNPQAFPDSHGDGNSVPDLLEEARIGLDWMYKVWDPARNVLYYQVGDAGDHDGWRMPEDDDSNPGRPARPVWACEPGKGANLAGKASAAFALASTLWGDRSRPYYDPPLAAAYLTAAKQLYAFGAANPGVQNSTNGFYEEASWRDDMAMAAAELYRATGSRSYLAEAKRYIQAAGTPYTLDWGELQSLAHYEIARLDPTHRQAALGYLANHLQAYKASANVNPFRVGAEQLFWGSSRAIIGVALEELFYRDLGGPATYRAVGQAQRDYMLGLNPWGVCMVNSVGTVWPRHPHHQIGDLRGIQLVGFWGPGPDAQTSWQQHRIELSATDPYADYQSAFSIYHDDVADYVTNEPTILANAWGLMLVAWYAR